MDFKLNELQNRLIRQEEAEKQRQEEEFKNVLNQLTENGSSIQSNKLEDFAETSIEDIANLDSEHQYRKVLGALTMFNISKKDGNDVKQEL